MCSQLIRELIYIKQQHTLSNGKFVIVTFKGSRTAIALKQTKNKVKALKSQVEFFNKGGRVQRSGWANSLLRQQKISHHLSPRGIVELTVDWLLAWMEMDYSKQRTFDG